MTSSLLLGSPDSFAGIVRHDAVVPVGCRDSPVAEANAERQLVAARPGVPDVTFQATAGEGTASMSEGDAPYAFQPFSAMHAGIVLSFTAATLLFIWIGRRSDAARRSRIERTIGWAMVAIWS